MGLSVETFWVPGGDTLKKPYLEEWERLHDEERSPVKTSRTRSPELQN